MKRYCLVLLSKGPNRVEDMEQAAALQRSHLDTLHKLQAEGKLLLAGPMLDEGSLRGILILDTEEISEAKTLVSRDPAINTGHLSAEIHPLWYGSAALTKMPAIHNQLAKKKV